MKTMKLFLLLGVGLLSGTAASAQTDNKYLDDAYYRRSDLQKIDKEARRQAEIRRAAERAEREAWEKEQATLIANYKKKQADREIDAYNGHLALPEDTITLTRSELGRLLKEQRQKTSGAEVYGPYSSRLNRFYGDGSVTIQGARRVYIDSDPWYSGIDYRYAGDDVYVRVGSSDPFWGNRFSWGTGWGWDSWYDPFYSSSYYYGYPRYYGSWYGGYYAPYYYGYSRGYYGGYYGARYGGWYDGYYDGYYGGYYPGYGYGYAAGAATRAYNEHYYNNPYSHGARSSARRSGGYSAYTSVRDEGYIRTPRSYDQGSSSQSRSVYNDDARSYESGRSTQQRNYDLYPQRSYDQGSSRSTNNSNSGGGGGYTAPPRRR